MQAKFKFSETHLMQSDISCESNFTSSSVSNLLIMRRLVIGILTLKRRSHVLLYV